jgi:hypothetical protein
MRASSIGRPSAQTRGFLHRADQGCRLVRRAPRARRHGAPRALSLLAARLKRGDAGSRGSYPDPRDRSLRTQRLSDRVRAHRRGSHRHHGTRRAHHVRRAHRVRRGTHGRHAVHRVRPVPTRSRAERTPDPSSDRARPDERKDVGRRCAVRLSRPGAPERPPLQPTLRLPLPESPLRR